MASPKAQTIARLNDQFRRGDPSVPGTRVITAGINEMLKSTKIPPESLAELVADISEFTEANDPHGEHDFGQFEFHGYECFWKIDYYSKDYQMGSDDPTDLTKTNRVLTIMLADEW